ncbi:MAG TPA: PH domain-containing protein, partial [Candidatus Saccharimonadales bacterium]
MVNVKSVEDQLKKLRFNKGWNKPETDELAAILLPDEQILECVNGWYEGGFALLCATNIRLLLVDKKPFNFLNIEDLRFDMINQIDYFHRMFNASICISTGVKKLLFRSYNQPRLRKLINHVQHRMAELKKTEQDDKAKNQGSLDEMNQQFKAYLLNQYQHEQQQSIGHQQEPDLSATPNSGEQLVPASVLLNPQPTNTQEQVQVDDG